MVHLPRNYVLAIVHRWRRVAILILSGGDWFDRARQGIASDDNKISTHGLDMRKAARTLIRSHNVSNWRTMLQIDSMVRTPSPPLRLAHAHRRKGMPIPFRVLEWDTTHQLRMIWPWCGLPLTIAAPTYHYTSSFWKPSNRSISCTASPSSRRLACHGR